ncbi:MAG: DNA-processing protein DprA [Candidatus Omnitrophota bacterium]
MIDQKTIDWLRLILIPEIGPRRGKELLKRFSGPGEILDAPQKAIASVLSASLAEAIVRQRNSINIKLDEQLYLIKKHKAKIIAQDDPAYPENLKNIFDPPLVLFLRGEILPEDMLSIAIVGTRMASLYGINMARKISSQLGQRGFTIVSGGARGIDSASHQAALKINARTIAVLGCGVDEVYPFENIRLFEQIIQKGALVSEFPMGTRPLRQNFPQRNRIISGLSLGVVVIEAPMRSGSLITVSSALEQGRDVFCVPGQADSFNMKGSHQLLKDGAKLVEDADDIMEELSPLLKKEQAAGHNLPQAGLTGGEAELYSLLSANPIGLEEIVRQSRKSVSMVSALLTQLEIKGLTCELPGKRFLLNSPLYSAGEILKD